MDLPPQTLCVAQAVYSEARGESRLGQRAVAHVIINRKRSSKFPNTYCGVVKQRGQFTYKYGRGPQWLRAKAIAANPGSDPTNGSLYFRAVYSKVRWTLTYVKRIGNHIFYK